MLGRREREVKFEVFMSPISGSHGEESAEKFFKPRGHIGFFVAILHDHGRVKR